MKRMLVILRIIFIKSNLPLGIFTISLYTNDVLRYGEENTGFLICVILFILSFVSECVLDKLLMPNEVHKPVHEVSNSLFPAIDLLNEVSKQRSLLLSAIHEYNTSLFEEIKATNNNIDATIIVLNNYIYNTKQTNEYLGDKVKICGKVFEKLSSSADLANRNLKSLNHKLSSSCIALVAVENQEKMLKDINLTFAKIFIEQSMDVNTKIQRILDSLGNISYKCANIQNFPKPYKDIIDLYGLKIEAVFTILDRKKFNLLWEEHMQCGKSCVYNDPIKAITEINEAIQIKPECAESYYYRGMAYQLKAGPDYRAALKDFEKALELKPDSNLYIKYIEALKNKINGDTKEQNL